MCANAKVVYLKRGGGESSYLKINHSTALQTPIGKEEAVAFSRQGRVLDCKKRNLEIGGTFWGSKNKINPMTKKKDRHLEEGWGITNG